MPRKTVAPAASKHQLLPLEKIVLSKRVNREQIDEKSDAFRELVASIRETGGVLQPILVRPHPKRKGLHELVAGERRFRAAKAAGCKKMSCMVRAMTDQEAAAFQLTENVHREDLAPLEEAAQIRAILDAGNTTAEIAALLGRTQRFVQRRASLTCLIPEWRKAVADPKSAFSRWAATALEKVAKLPESTQAALLNDWRHWHPDNIADLQHDELDAAIGDETQELKRARWKLDDASLDPKAGPCSECRKRAGHQPLLWDGLADLDMTDPKAAKSDICLDPECWKRKLAAYITARTKELREKHADLVLIATSYNGHHANPGSIRDYDVATAKKGAKGATPALVVDGPGAGGLRWIKQSPSRGGSVVGLKKGPTPLKERRAKLAERRETSVIQDIQNALAQKRFDELAMPGADPKDVILRLVAAFGTEQLGGTFGDFKNTHEVEIAGLYEELWDCVKRNIPCETMRFAKDCAEFLGADLDEFKARAEQEIPEPKSWAKLKEDGTPKSAAQLAKEKPAKPVKRANFMPPTGNVHVNQFDVITHGYESISIPIRKTARGSLTIEVAQYVDRGKDVWYAAEVAEFYPGSSHCPISISGTSYETREAAILAILEDHAGMARCGEPGSKAAVKRGKMRQEDIRAFLEAAKKDPSYLQPAGNEEADEKAKGA